MIYKLLKALRIECLHLQSCIYLVMIENLLLEKGSSTIATIATIAFTVPPASASNSFPRLFCYPYWIDLIDIRKSSVSLLHA